MTDSIVMILVGILIGIFVVRVFDRIECKKTHLNPTFIYQPGSHPSVPWRIERDVEMNGGIVRELWIGKDLRMTRWDHITPPKK